MFPETSEYDFIPVPHAATVELGRHRDCVRQCKSCAFNETPLAPLSAKDVLKSMDTLAKYWNAAGENPDIQLVGARIVEFLGIAGAMDRYKREDLQAITDAAVSHKLAQVAFMSDAFMDRRAIKDFFEAHAQSAAAAKAKGVVPPKGVIALSIDSLPVKNPHQGRELKSAQSWMMVGEQNQLIKDPETQSFRVFTTMSKSNLKDIPTIAEKVLEGGNLLFVAPITAHAPEMLAKTGITGRLLMGSDVSDLLTEEDAPLMEEVVGKLRALKEKYPAKFLNGEGNFLNMMVACKPLLEAFRNNCRESCKFTLKGGEVLNCTPNIRVVKHPGEGEMKLAICTCFVGPRGNGEHYADTPLSYLEDAGSDTEKVVDSCRRLTRDLAEIACLGCNCRTAIDIKTGCVLK